MILSFQNMGISANVLSLILFCLSWLVSFRILLFCRTTEVKNVTVSDNEVIIKTDKSIDLKAHLVIGCDGANSIIRKKLTDNKNVTHDGSVAFRAYFKNVKDTPAGTLEFHFLKDFLPGYFWIFPLTENQFNVGLGMPSKIISEKKINLRNEIMRIIETDPYLSSRFSGAEMISEIKGHFLPLLSRKIQISGNRFLLCGDAASLINPATGGGIGQAMQSGRFAGWQAMKCFEKNDFSGEFNKEYDKTVYEKLWKENKHYLLIRDHIFKYPWRLNTVVSTGSKSKFIYNTILKALK